MYKYTVYLYLMYICSLTVYSYAFYAHYTLCERTLGLSVHAWKHTVYNKTIVLK